MTESFTIPQRRFLATLHQNRFTHPGHLPPISASERAVLKERGLIEEVFNWACSWAPSVALTQAGADAMADDMVAFHEQTAAP